MSTHSNFFIRLISGGVSLPVTYWVFYILIGNIIAYSIEGYWKSAGFLDADIIMSYTETWIFLVTFLILLVYFVLSAIAVWKSATKYKGPMIWVVLARTAVILGALVGISGLF